MKSAPGVLIIDDDTSVQSILSSALADNYAVQVASTGEEGLRHYEQVRPDVVLLDVMLPEMNGYELAESLRNRSDYRDTPLIAVTGYTEYDDRGRSLRAGFNAHITKPINPSHLLDVISELLD